MSSEMLRLAIRRLSCEPAPSAKPESGRIVVKVVKRDGEEAMHMFRL